MPYYWRTVFYFLCISYLLLFSSCTTRLADMTILSTQNVSLDRVDLDTLPKTQGVVGKDSVFIVLFIPFGVPHLENAVDDALTKGNGDIMTDVVIYSKGWWFLVGQSILEVKGNVVRTRSVK